MHIWNLPLHGWCWSIIAEMLSSMGELVALSQATIPHKRFISTLVRRRAGVSVPMEIELSLGMRKYMVLITGEREILSKLHNGLGRYVLAKDGSEAEICASPERRFTHEIPLVEKEKAQKPVPSLAVEPCSRVRDLNVCPNRR